LYAEPLKKALPGVTKTDTGVMRNFWPIICQLLWFSEYRNEVWWL